MAIFLDIPLCYEFGFKEALLLPPCSFRAMILKVVVAKLLVWTVHTERRRHARGSMMTISGIRQQLVLGKLLRRRLGGLASNVSLVCIYVLYVVSHCV